jgi:hypothetical protein
MVRPFGRCKNCYKQEKIFLLQIFKGSGQFDASDLSDLLNDTPDLLVVVHIILGILRQNVENLEKVVRQFGQLLRVCLLFPQFLIQEFYIEPKRQ